RPEPRDSIDRRCVAAAGRPYIILRDTYAGTIAHAGVTVPAGTSPYKFVAMACGNKTPDCPRINDAIRPPRSPPLAPI
ncbi:MAG TPA: hypothetical protein VHV81_00680, partial [Steroidobacteraceae bacterium]|nr:hypothetical protein [Steroidobacteraceae bacterium]